MREKLLAFQQKKAGLFRDRLYNAFLTDTRKLEAECYISSEPVKFCDRLKLEKRAIKEGDSFGKRWDNAWFHLTGTIPAEWVGKPVWVHLNLGGEILIFNDSGVPVFGLTNHSVYNPFYLKEHYEVTASAESNSKVDFWCEVCANGLFGEEEKIDSNGKVIIMEYGVYDDEMFQLWDDVFTLISLLESYEQPCARKYQIAAALEQAEGIYGEEPENASAAREVLKKQLSFRATDSELSTTVVGHAHIDVGWLWAVRESIRKSARTFASQLDNIERYPEYIFGASQPQLYLFIKENYPELYEKIKAQVKAGRWECQGGMWVEADCNIISGESMIRQFLHGKNFFKDEFGVDVKNLWIPDVFGYSAAMPQIIKKCNCNYFLTQKISWSQFNKFPYHTFMWEGIDGSRVLTHFPPEDTYNSNLDPKSLVYARNNFSEAAFLPEFMTLAGIGDGGGGPSMRHIENGRRTANLEGVPKVKFGKADDFFKRLEKYIPQLPRWVGELYLELHRGTLTTQSRTKRNNRKCEEILAATEFIYSCLPADKYPAEELDKMWKCLLCNQFHDIIPGSSVRQVYTVTEEEHAKIIAKCEELISNAGAMLSDKDDDTLTLVNTLGYEIEQIITLPDSWIGHVVTDIDGNALETQCGGGKALCLVTVPAAGSKVIKRAGKCGCTCEESDNTLVLENDLIRYEFNSDAVLVSAYDKESKRELVCGGGNRLAVYVDQPVCWDAWDIDYTYLKTPAAGARGISAKKTENGSLRQTLSFELAVGKSSKLRQEIRLGKNSKQLDFVTEADWHESHRMLRVSFRTCVNAAEATCDIQYGKTMRPTHTNTSWDFARFEVAALRYVDISDVNGGVALLNDCKYGYHLANDTLDLALLRSTKYPDYAADMGSHKFTYSLLPHAGSLIESDVMSRAAQLNRELTILPGKVDLAVPFALSDVRNVALGTVKKAEKSDDIIIRLAETDGRNGSIKLAFSDKVSVKECDMLEWNDVADIADKCNEIELKFTAFEIKTLRVKKQ